MTRAYFNASGLEVRKVADGVPVLVGYAVRWDKLSVRIAGTFREKVQRGAFTKSLKENDIRALWNHDSSAVLGSTAAGTMRAKEDSQGLHFEIDLPDTSWGRDAAVSVSRGDVTGVSFGFNARGQVWDESDPRNIIRTLTDVDLKEISPTPFPAYPQSTISARSISDDYTDYLKSINQNSNSGALILCRRRKLNLL
jgi:HK97 family phage prohead protease